MKKTLSLMGAVLFTTSLSFAQGHVETEAESSSSIDVMSLLIGVAIGLVVGYFIGSKMGKKA